MKQEFPWIPLIALVGKAAWIEMIYQLKNEKETTHKVVKTVR